MSIAKVIEILAEGDSIENAIDNAVKEAGRTVRNLRSAYVAETQAIIEDGKIAKYRVNVRLTFLVGRGDVD